MKYVKWAVVMIPFLPLLFLGMFISAVYQSFLVGWHYSENKFLDRIMALNKSVQSK